AATHGRSIWIVDVTPLRQMTAEVQKAKAHLFQPNTAYNWRTEPARGRTNRRFVGTNPPRGAQIYYSLTQPAEKVGLKIVDVSGATVRELRASAEPGLHHSTGARPRTPPRQTGVGQEVAAGTPGRGTRTGAGRAAAGEPPAAGQTPPKEQPPAKAQTPGKGGQP